MRANGEIPAPDAAGLPARNGAAFPQVVRELLRGGRPVRFEASGASMRPTICAGEAITVTPVAAEEVRRGDIVLFESPGGLLAHRVVDVRRDPDGRVVVVTRGDAALTPDEPVPAKALLGKVVSVERGGRTLTLDGRWARRFGRARAAAVHLLRVLRAILVSR